MEKYAKFRLKAVYVYGFLTILLRVLTTSYNG
jgi:hypothetical protein